MEKEGREETDKIYCTLGQSPRWVRGERARSMRESLPAKTGYLTRLIPVYDPCWYASLKLIAVRVMFKS